jgi:hypothetical protein
MFRIVSVCLFGAVIVSPASAVGVSHPITVAVTGGTLGIGPEITYRILPLIGVRASATFLGVSGHGHVSDYNYEGHAHLSNFGGTVDLHPFGNGLRLSAGARSTAKDKIRFLGVATRTQTYGGVTYTPEEAGTLSGDVKTRRVSPVATLGYAASTRSGISFGLDAGVMFHGRPRIASFDATPQLGTNPYAQPELAHQEQRIRDKVDNYPYYPVLQVSIGYRF